MQKKSPVLGAVLGLLIIGLIYSGGLKKGGLTALAIIVIGFTLNMLIDTTIFSLVGNIIGGVLGYMWTNDYNAAVERASAGDTSF